MHPFICCALAFIAVLALVACGRGKLSVSDREVFDGFEETKLSSIWRTDKLASDSIELQSSIVRTGSGALRISIREGDLFSAANSPDNPTGTGNERDELQERDDLMAREGEAWAYSFSLYLPKDFPIVPTRLVLAQWKQEGNHNKELVNNPVVALRYQDGELSISSQTDKKKVTLFHRKEDLRGKWTDFRFHIRFSRGADGYIQAWINDESVLQANKTTAYDESLGYPKTSTFYFKMGLYRDTMKEPMEVYIDEYKKSALPSLVGKQATH